MNQIFLHRPSSPTTLLHDLTPPEWFSRKYRKHALTPRRRLVGKPSRRK